MSYEERIKKIVGDDLFWIITINNFLKTTYEDMEKGINDLEKLAKDKEKFNEFTKQIVKRKDDLKSVKEEFINSQSSDFNIDSIVNQVVDSIKKLDDAAETSISALVNEPIDSKRMLQIYNLVVVKLKENGLFMNFGERENQRVGLPFNIPFKKGYIRSITIKARIYNGHYGKGSIFEEVGKFTLINNNATINMLIKFCIDPQIKDKATLESTIPFTMTKEEISNLDQILNTISKNYQHYDKSENTKVFEIKEYYNHADVRIDNINYSVIKNDEILLTLRKIIKYNMVKESIIKAYSELIK